MIPYEAGPVNGSACTELVSGGIVPIESSVLSEIPVSSTIFCLLSVSADISLPMTKTVPATAAIRMVKVAAVSISLLRFRLILAFALSARILAGDG